MATVTRIAVITVAGEQRVRTDGYLVIVGNRSNGLCFIGFVQPIVVANSASSCTGQHCLWRSSFVDG